MKSPGRFAIRWLLFLLALQVGAALSASLWPSFFGGLPAPKFWFVILIFILIYFPLKESIFLAYLGGYSITFYSGMNVKMIWFPLLVIFFVMRFLKSRMFWQGTTYFVMNAALGDLMFEFLYLGFSRILEANPAPILFWDRILSVLFTVIIAPPIYNLLLPLLERTTPEESIHEQG